MPVKPNMSFNGFMTRKLRISLRRLFNSHPFVKHKARLGLPAFGELFELLLDYVLTPDRL
jgi:hypothetical protein